VIRPAVVAVAVTLSVATAAAQSVVSGTVVGKLDSLPVAGAEIATANGLRVRTGLDGRFQIRVGHGDSLFVRAIGFRAEWFPAPGDALLCLEALSTTLPTLITTAGLRAMSLGESAASVTVIDREMIAATASVSANQLLRQIPGLQELSTPPSKTGIAIRGLDAARVLILVDGEPVVGTLLETRDIGRLSTLAAERIEITKGPSSVEFGSDALGGVINLVTAPPSATFHGEVTTRAGELGRREASASVSDTHGRLGYRASVGWRQADAVTAIGADGTSLDRVYDVRTDVRYKAGETIQLRGDVQLSRQRQRWPVGGGYNGFIDNRGAQALGEIQASKFGGHARLRMFAQYSDYQFRQAQSLAPIAGSADSLEQQEKLVRLLASFTRQAGAHLIDAGAQASVRAIVAPEKIEDDRADDRVFEFFARDRWVRGPVLVTAGGRATSGSLWGNALTPSLGLAIQLSDELRVRSSFAKGFRAPTFKEIRYTFANPAAGYVLEGNPDLEPESSSSLDAGLAWAPRQRVLVELDGYTTTVSNLIDTRFTSRNSGGFQVFQNVNVARARIQGIEASVRISHSHSHSSVSAGYNYLRARDVETGKRLDRRAAHTARIAASHSSARLRGLVTDVSVRYTGDAPLGDETLGDMISLDGQFRLPIASRVELSAGVNNILDERPENWAPSARRQVYVGIRAHTAGPE
jgi:outer membrane receptor for ferrienterochelin and colicins